MTAPFRRLIPSASSRTRHPQAICASAETSIAARGTYHDCGHRRALQFVFAGKLPRGATGNLGADPVKRFELFLCLWAVRLLTLAGSGTGLGLVQALRFVEGRGGTIGIESEQGADTLVRPFLPRVCCAAVPSAAAETEIAYTPSPDEDGCVFRIVNAVATAPTS
jgi:hypothetical protein